MQAWFYLNLCLGAGFRSEFRERERERIIPISWDFGFTSAATEFETARACRHHGERERERERARAPPAFMSFVSFRETAAQTDRNDFKEENKLLIS